MTIVISRQMCFVPIVVSLGDVWDQSAWTNDTFVQMQHLMQRDRAINAARCPDRVQQSAVHEASTTSDLDFASVQAAASLTNAECLTGELVAHTPDPQSKTRCIGPKDEWSSPRKGATTQKHRVQDH